MKYKYQDRIFSDLKIINRVVLNIIEDIKNILNDEDICFDIRLILNELLINSHEHGNKKDFKKCIKLNLDVLDNQIFIEVTDEGSGFERKNRNYNTLAENGRGLMIVESLVDNLIIEDNSVKCKISY